MGKTGGLIETLKEIEKENPCLMERISYQDVSPPKSFDMKNRPKPKIRPIDYHLEYCMKAGIW